ncbi:unnamed protein product [Miscanthus lutarioriparius]|uniref:Uncharacterized protein n=1 Tax=Miscanthus lutarioriparius TaxID=422564 RepID=A0A811QDK6_9POAL|nr:unnamed protein product [Miscanthus lutarioriparius]
MGDAQAPGGYFVGRPANYEEKPQDAADAQNRGSTPPGFHASPAAEWRASWLVWPAVLGIHSLNDFEYHL